jgi:hypothetical protein
MRITAPAFLVMVSVCGAFQSACTTPNRFADKEEPVQSENEKRVELGPTGLRYFEGPNVMELTVEMASDGRGDFYIVYVPTPTTWVREMPPWCRHRRDEVLSEIRKLTKKRRIKWVDEE